MVSISLKVTILFSSEIICFTEDISQVGAQGLFFK